MTVKPWVITLLKTGAVFLLFFIIGSLILFFKGLNDRIDSLEREPVTITKVVTATPTATPSATIKPIKRAVQPTVVPSK